MRNLGRAFERRRKGDKAANVERAITCQTRSLLAFPPQTHPTDWAATLHSLGHAYRARGRDAGGVNLTLAAEAFQKALAVYTAAEDSTRRAEIMYSLGHLHETFAQGNADEYLDVALDYYRQVINTVSMSPAFAESGRAGGDAIVEHGSPIADAQVAINRIARMRAGEGKLPSDVENGVMLGKVVFLRPFALHDQIRLRNDFKIYDSPLPRWEVEPETLSVEEVMNRALGNYVSFHALGGASETYGGAHLYVSSADQWQFVVEEVMIPVGDLFIVIPHDSPGLRWEVETLKAHDALSKCLFIMPPASGEHYSADTWQQTGEMMQGYGLRLPQYDEAGMLFRLGADGEVEETWSFDAVWTGGLIEQIKHLFPEPVFPEPDEID